MRRRRLLALAGSTLPAALAGCIETTTSEEESPEQPEDNHSESDDEGQKETDGENGQSAEWTEPDWPTGPYADYDSTIVDIYGEGDESGENGETLGTVKTAIAETSAEWELGLSDAESMPENGGMLFVSDSSKDRSFWMRNMDFGLDIVYVGENRAITSIHHAPAPGPEDGTEQIYYGEGQYVLEVNYEWTTERGISEGDTLAFDL